MSSLQIRVCGRFRIQQKLYEGKHSSIYRGKNVQSGSDCAIKCQLKSSSPSFVMNEGKILQNIQGGVGISNLLWFGENGDYKFLVTELLGNSLEDYFDICERKFSLKTVLMIADKILSSIQFIHYKNYVHRDIKPENFVVGLGRKLHQIYTIDLAFATTYLDPVTRNHRPNQINQSQFVGTLKFASLNVHQGHKNSRRDDLQSIGLMLIYFLKGSLPWQKAQGLTLKDKRANIRKIMEKTTLDQLCQGVPQQINQYLAYCRGLKFEQAPDYNYIRRLFKERFVKEGYLYDNIYDWILIPLKLKDTEISNRVPLNRFVKKQNPSLSMCNSDYNFQIDFLLQQKPIQIKKKQPIEEKKQKSQIMSQEQLKKVDKKGSKKQKQDCIIY